MTFARPVGMPTGPVTIDRTVSRAGLFAGAGVLAAINAQADTLIFTFTKIPLATALSWLGGVSAVIWFALFATLKIGLEPDDDRATARDTAILAATVMLSFLPITHAAVVAVLLTGSYLFATSRHGSSSRRVALVLLALTGPLLWGRLLLNVFAAPILALDANVVGTMIGSPVIGNVVEFADHGKSFLIGGPCSSVHNISLAIVLWATAAALFELRIDRRYIATGLAMVSWMFAINVVRLAAIGLFPADFDTLHGGTGAAMFGWAGLIGAALLVGFGVVNAAARQR